MSLLDKTNLLITPNAVKAGKLYSVIPASGAGDCTVLRNTTATRVNSAGVIVSSVANVPRLTYLTVAGNPFILDEPQRTNIFNYTQDFSNSYWSKSRVLISLNSTSAPDSTFTASKLIANTDNNSHFFDSSLQNNTGTSTQSIFAKQGELRYLQFSAGFLGGVNVVFDLQNGIITTSVGVIGSSKMELINGFYRCSCSYATSGNYSASFGLAINPNPSRREIFTGNNTDGIFIWGAQLEQNSTISSYIPALIGAAVTRNADVITVAPPAGTVKITTTFSDNTTQILTTIPATFTLPEGLIKQVLMQNSL